jgi:hypothetical protein
MKKLFLALLMISVTMLSCTKQSLNNARTSTGLQGNQPLTYNTSQQASVIHWNDVNLGNIGSIHNDIMNSLNQSVITTNGLDLYRNTLDAVVSNDPVYAYHDYIFENSSIIYDKIKDHTFWDYYTEIANAAYGSLETNDQVVFGQVMSVLSNTYSDDHLIDLKTDLSAIKANYSGSSDLINGTLEIGLNSYLFWKRDDVVLDGPKGIVVQADAAGYIIGWAKAWLWDNLTTSKDRINAGLGTAGAASGMFLLKKWGKF